MKIYEYRIICPCSVEQYKVGSIYMTAKRSEEESKQVKGEGVETVKNETFSNDKESGVYTYKILHFKSKVPSTIRWAIPDSFCHCHEQSWNAFPHVHTQYHVPGMADDFSMSIDSYYAPYKNDQPIPDNLLNLSKEDMRARQVAYLDILDGKPKPEKNRDLSDWSSKELNVNSKFSSFRPEKKKNPFAIETGQNSPELKPPEWTKNFKGEMMVAVKVVKINFVWKGLQTIVENYLSTTFYHNLFLTNHRAMMLWAKDWAKMSVEDARKFEAHVYANTNSQGFERGSGDENKKNDEVVNKKQAVGSPKNETKPVETKINQ